MNLPVGTAYYSQKRRHLTRKLSGRIKTCLKKAHVPSILQGN